MNNPKNIQRVIALLRIVAHLPLGVLYVFSDLCYYVMYYVVRYRRDVVRKNLRNSFPEKTEAERLQIEKKFYRHLCDIFIESFKCLCISDEEMQRRVEVRNTELVEQTAEEGRSVILLLGHCGCWEWAQEIATRYKKPTINGEIYKHIDDVFAQELMNAIRGRWDTILIEMRQAMRTLLRFAKEGEPFLMGFISDQRAYTYGGLKRWTVFMNQYTDFVSGGEELARKIGARLLFLDMEKPSRGHYCLTFKEIVPEDMSVETSYTRHFYKMLEESIRRQPEIWLWSHNRWCKSYEYEEFYAPYTPNPLKINNQK